MGTYKVIQDIEAEDKLLGPLSLRQFIYALIVIVSLFIGFKMMTAPGPIKYFTVLLMPHTVFFAVLAAPFGHDQSNEVWLLAKIRFFFKPRKRIWDQTGMKDLVTITAPKKVEKQLTKDFSRDEARNRLKALANTLDTRGWAVKNIGVNMFNQPAPQMPIYNNNMVDPTDRLVDVSTTDPQTEDNIATPYDDLDSKVAQQFSEQIAKSKKNYQAQLSNLMHIPSSHDTQSTTEEDINWFAPETPDDQIFQNPNLQKDVLSNEMTGPKNHTEKTSKHHNDKKPDSTVTTPMNPDIMNLANNDDLNVETVQHLADKSVEKDDGEVVISLR